MKHLTELLNEIKTREFKISQTKNGECIQQTQRNALKSELLTAIMLDIKECYEFTYQSSEGILLEIANETIASGIDSESEGSGAITACIDLKIKNLDCNAEFESADFMQKLSEKLAKAEERAKKKADKIERDTAERKAKKGE